jgi:hypothetical protein
MLLFVRSVVSYSGRMSYLDRECELRIDAVGRLGILFGSHGEGKRVSVDQRVLVRVC